MTKRAAMVLLADLGYLDKVKQVIYTAFVYGNWPGEFVLFTDVTDAEPLRWFRERGVYVYTPPVPAMAPEQCAWAAQWPPLVFAKLFMFHPEMRRWDTIAFLDADIIVRRDLIGLLRFSGFTARYDQSDIAYQFLLPEQVVGADARAKLARLRQRYDFSAPAFNVGVMTVSTADNTEALYRRLTEMAEEYADVVRYPEQAVLNLAFARRWRNLPVAYNCPDVTKAFREAPSPRRLLRGRIAALSRHSSLTDVALIHFWGDVKPWQEHSAYYREWHDNLANADRLFGLAQVGEVCTTRQVLRLNVLRTYSNAMQAWHNGELTSARVIRGLRAARRSSWLL